MYRNGLFLAQCKLVAILQVSAMSDYYIIALETTVSYVKNVLKIAGSNYCDVQLSPGRYAVGEMLFKK